MTAPVGAPQRSMILDQSIKVLYHSILVLALYFEFAGHNLPGGGFVGGLIAGAAVSLRYASGGAEAVRTTFRAPSHVILGFGLFLSSATALVPVLLGGAVLEHASYEMNLPIFGTVKVVSALPFDAGVFLVVVGLVLMAFAAFGDDRVANETDDEAAQ
ncbi:MnhB domain-containing protein [uncultured Ilumatobacter sp.]|jgi:multisubunit Na+/H+ antiporter MnhB subunit|uniref:MnhB domain-containing protein n=1 Tax=Ilumatobacter sp. TaxID=1967498 RepID=UPI0030AB823B|tara:strand:+ start:495 stop:968 length:474 start_codon:yes stop_codon:yes gene_type:complete